MLAGADSITALDRLEVSEPAFAPQFVILATSEGCLDDEGGSLGGSVFRRLSAYLTSFRRCDGRSGRAQQVDLSPGGHSASPVEGGAMTLLRNLMTVVLALAILPWGGVAAAVVAQRAAQTQAVEVAPEIKVSAPRKCRGSFLPGWPCGQERWHEPAAPTGVADAGQIVVWVPENWVGSGQVPTPAREPPRTV